jgi:hypothetical protein
MTVRNGTNNVTHYLTSSIALRILPALGKAGKFCREVVLIS